jgi:hypothetical protein
MKNRYLYNFNIVPLGPRIRPFYHRLQSLRAGSHYNRAGLWWYLFIRTPSYLYESNKMCVIIVQNRHCWTITLWVILLLVYYIKLAGVQYKVWNPPPGERFEPLVIGLWLSNFTFSQFVRTLHQWRTEGGFGCSTPPPPKFQSFTKSNRIANWAENV